MPRIDEVYPSQWLRAADLNGQKCVATIEHVEIGQVGSGKDQKTQIILTFAEYDKPLGTNKTNAGRIGDVYGPETDDWIGQQVVLFPTKVDFNNNEVDAIRVDKAETMNLFRAALRAAKQIQQRPAQAAVPVTKPRPVRATAPMTQEEVDADGDIPF